jgi:hypothetical protein
MSDFESDHPTNLKQQGDDYFNKGNYREAILSYKKSLDHDPYNPSVWNNLGFAFFRLGKLKEAEWCRKRKKNLELELKNNISESSVQVIEDLRYDSEYENFFIDALSWERQSDSPDSPNTTYPDAIRDEEEQSRIDHSSKTGAAPREGDLERYGHPEPSKILTQMEAPPGYPEIQKIPEEQQPFKGAGYSGKFKLTGFLKKISAFFPHFLESPYIPSEDMPREDFTEKNSLLKNAIIISTIIGICVFIFLILGENQSDGYTQFYLLPDSYENDLGPNITSVSFIYGVRSFEKEEISYQLQVYQGTNKLKTVNFSLQPSELREEQVSIDGLTLNSSQKIELILISPFSRYNLHYWINSRS